MANAGLYFFPFVVWEPARKRNLSYCIVIKRHTETGNELLIKNTELCQNNLKIVNIIQSLTRQSSLWDTLCAVI